MLNNCCGTLTIKGRFPLLATIGVCAFRYASSDFGPRTRRKKEGKKKREKEEKEREKKEKEKKKDENARQLDYETDASLQFHL